MIKLLNLITEVKETFESFAQVRLRGSEKITKNAKEKGGPSLLTWNHFKVKLPYYKKASEGKFNVDDAKKEYKELLEQLYTSTKNNMSIKQTEFQQIMGKLEVLGELIVKNKS